jgi:hypothetical protein
MLTAVQSINLALRFTLEMALLAALALWAWRSITPRGLRLTATVGLPIVAMAIWGSVVHRAGIPSAVQLATQVALFSAATTALVRIRRTNLALVFSSVVIANAVLMAVWAQ